ncbi:MAG: S8 family peptidase [Cyclobacteriaceae bacterium]|nr:S8 family peptidase [Cyclobacteriaceae bacterium]
MDIIRFYIFFILMLFLSVSHAQVNQYMVFFADKSGTPYSVSNPSAYLSSKAIQRRAIQNIPVVESDLPVNPAYITNIENTGASVIYKTKWMNGVLVSCDASLLPAINALPEVSSIEYVSPGAHPSAGGRKKSVKEKKDTKEAATDNQLSLLGIDEMHADGHRGEGVTIAVFDGGFSGANLTAPFTHIFSENRFDAVASYDFVHGGHEVFQYDDHGTRVWSVIAAYSPGSFIGGAYKANFQLYVTEDVPTEYRVEEYNWLFAAERADSAGVDIINSSLGYNIDFDDASMDYSTGQMDGETAIITRAAQFAADKGMLVVTSAGNEGLDASWRIITAPADGRDVLAVGSVNSFMVRSPTSSVGPTADGRIKPDLVALGSGTSVVRANGSITTGSGTSFSAPLVTGLAAGLWQRQPGLSNKKLIEAIRMSASLAPNPDNFLGYGLPNYTAAKHYIEQVEQEELFAVFPNPITHDTLTIRPKNPEDLTPVVILLVSAQGQIIRDQNVNFTWLNNQYTADLSFLSAGIYLIRIQAGEQVFVYKIVKI